MRRKLIIVFLLITLLSGCTNKSIVNKYSSNLISSDESSSILISSDSESTPSSSSSQSSSTVISSAPKAVSQDKPNHKYDMLYPICVNEKYGFMDIKGNVIVEPQYDDAGDFSEGYARVSKEGLYGYIDLTGEIVIPLKYEDCGDFCNNLATVIKNDLAGYINKSDELVIDYMYLYASRFSENIAMVSLPEEGYATSYIDLKGNIIATFNTLHCGEVHNGMIRVYASYYNLKGEEVFGDWFSRNGIVEHSPYDFSEGLSVYPVLKKEYWNTPDDKFNEIFYDWSNWEYVYRNTKGQKVLSTYEDAESFSEGLAIVKKNGEYGVIDKTGKMIFKHSGLVSNCKSGYFVYKQDDKYGFVDKTGKEVITAQYDKVVKEFTDGLAYVSKGDVGMYIDKSGKVIWSEKLVD